MAMSRSYTVARNSVSRCMTMARDTPYWPVTVITTWFTLRDSRYLMHCITVTRYTPYWYMTVITDWHAVDSRCLTKNIPPIGTWQILQLGLVCMACDILYVAWQWHATWHSLFCNGRIPPSSSTFWWWP